MLLYNFQLADGSSFMVGGSPITFLSDLQQLSELLGIECQDWTEAWGDSPTGLVHYVYRSNEDMVADPEHQHAIAQYQIRDVSASR